MDEAKLIAGLKAGDYECYKTLFRLHYARLVCFVDGIIEDRYAAEDLVQEAFMKVWLNRAKLEEHLSIENYLFVLVKRAMLNFLRDRKFAEDISSEVIQGVPNSVSADQRLDVNETWQKIQSRVTRMPERRKTVFRLSRDRGLSNKEIAAVLKLSEKTVERHITLALQDLRKIFS